MTKIMCCVLVLVFTTEAISQESAMKKENPYLWESKITSVTVFKNGLGFFLREGQTELRDGWCMSGAIPPASFGTLAIFPHEEDRTVDIIGSGPGDVVEFDGIDAPDDIETRCSRLEDSMYLKIELSYMENNRERIAAGKLVEVGSEYIILEAEDNNFAVPLEGITKLTVLENPLRIHVTSDDNEPVEETKLGMAYLRKGITWIPEYTLKIIDEDTAELTLRGTLVNEAEDLIHCDVQFVVGVPHFIHTDYLTPISIGQTIRTIGASIAPNQVMGQQIMNRAGIAVDNSNRSNQFNINSSTVTDSSERDLRNSLGNLPQLEASGSSDYTVYERKDLTLRVGEKAIVTLFTKTIKYRHGYRWKPGSDIDHYLILENNTDSSFTTGPCLVMSENRALSEDLLKYVPRGGAGELLVTTAINIAKEQNEKETDRELKVYNVNSYYYDMVTMEGELKIRNYESTAVNIIVEMEILGRPLSTSDDAKIKLNTENLVLMQRTATVTWQLTLEPNETKTLTYTYERYVPSR